MFVAFTSIRLYIVKFAENVALALFGDDEDEEEL
jgi:hypothetical protein